MRQFTRARDFRKSASPAPIGRLFQNLKTKPAKPFGSHIPLSGVGIIKWKSLAKKSGRRTTWEILQSVAARPSERARKLLAIGKDNLAEMHQGLAVLGGIADRGDFVAIL